MMGARGRRDWSEPGECRTVQRWTPQDGKDVPCDPSPRRKPCESSTGSTPREGKIARLATEFMHNGHPCSTPTKSSSVIFSLPRARDTAAVCEDTSVSLFETLWGSPPSGKQGVTSDTRGSSRYCSRCKPRRGRTKRVGVRDGGEGCRRTRSGPYAVVNCGNRLLPRETCSRSVQGLPGPYLTRQSVSSSPTPAAAGSLVGDVGLLAPNRPALLIVP